MFGNGTTLAETVHRWPEVCDERRNLGLAQLRRACSLILTLYFDCLNVCYWRKLAVGTRQNSAQPTAPFSVREPIKTRKAAGVHLTRKMTLEDAFQVISLNCLQQIETNIPGVLKQDVEGLHQMCVGLRRLSALLNMFEKLVTQSFCGFIE